MGVKWEDELGGPRVDSLSRHTRQRDVKRGYHIHPSIFGSYISKSSSAVVYELRLLKTQINSIQCNTSQRKPSHVSVCNLSNLSLDPSSLTTENALQRSTPTSLDSLPGDVLALLRNEERHQLCNIFWFLNTSKFDVTFHSESFRRADSDAFDFSEFAVDVVPHGCVDDAWSVRYQKS